MTPTEAPKPAVQPAAPVTPPVQPAPKPTTGAVTSGPKSVTEQPKAKDLSQSELNRASALYRAIEHETEPNLYNEYNRQYEDLTGKEHYHSKNVKDAIVAKEDLHLVRYDSNGVPHEVDRETGKTIDGAKTETSSESGSKDSKAASSK